MTFLDDVGNEIRIGDSVKVTAIDSGRGAILGLTGNPGKVVGFGRTRVRIDFPSRTGVDNVGSELLHVTATVDGRTLRTWSDVHTAEGF